MSVSQNLFNNNYVGEKLAFLNVIMYFLLLI